MVPNIEGTEKHNIKIRNQPRQGTECVNYKVSNKQKPSKIISRKCNNCIWASLVQLVA